MLPKRQTGGHQISSGSPLRTGHVKGLFFSRVLRSSKAPIGSGESDRSRCPGAEPVTAGVTASGSAQSQRRTAAGGITAGQRRRLFALARERGLDLDQLRAATPAGSVSALSHDQAAAIIERLGGSADVGAFSPRGDVTRRQLGMIEHLRELVGFDAAGFSAWLRRFGCTSTDAIDDRRRASHVIAALVKMHAARRSG